MSAPGDDSSVKVAIRIRPQLAREQLEGARVTLEFVHLGEGEPLNNRGLRSVQ